MDLLTEKDLQILIEKHNGFHLSIFLPTFRAGKKTKQNAIRFKNLLAEAKDRLVAEGLRPPQAKAFLEPAYRYLREVSVWRYQSDGLAVFISGRDFFHYRLPLSFQELVLLGTRFHIKPLLPLFHNNGTFFVLALSLHHVRWFQCSRFWIHPIDLPKLPKSIDEALQYDNIEKQLQFHTGMPGPRGKQAPVFHGQGVGIDDTRDHIVRYFRQIDRGLHDILKEENNPLLLAAVDYLHPIYKTVNTYPGLVDEGIMGNPDEWNDRELHERAWQLMQPQFLRSQREAISAYRSMQKNDRASHDIRMIIPASMNGRVQTLFVANDIFQWGRFNPQTQQVTVHDKKVPQDEDLLDLVAVQALMHRGAVYTMNLESMPGHVPAASVFRY
jgi:hypothetical protein